MATIRNQVFISYAHQDRKWKDRLLTHLAPLIRYEKLSVWDDGQIPPGTKWLDEIASALSRARVAVLLVTPNFLASRFIAEDELPPLLQAAEKEGLRILWISVSACHFEVTAINDYQSVNNPARPLDTYVRSPHRLNAEFVKIVKEIPKAFEDVIAVSPQAVVNAQEGVKTDLGETPVNVESVGAEVSAGHFPDLSGVWRSRWAFPLVEARPEGAAGLTEPRPPESRQWFAANVLTIVQRGDRLHGTAQPGFAYRVDNTDDAEFATAGYEFEAAVDRDGNIKGDWWTSSPSKVQGGRFTAKVGESGTVVHCEFSRNDAGSKRFEWIWHRK